MKNSVKEMTTELANLGNRANQMEEKIVILKIKI